MIAKAKRPKRIITMEAEAFAANCLSLIDEVYEHDIEIIVTRRGEPLVRVVRYVETKSAKKARSTKS
jgi:prevent-host-death family protein